MEATDSGFFVQSEEAIRHILEEARQPAGIPAALKYAPAEAGSTGPGQPPARDFLDEMVDDALLHPNDDSDSDM